MRVVRHVGNVLLVCLLLVAGYGVPRAVRDGQHERRHRDDHRRYALRGVDEDCLVMRRSHRRPDRTRVVRRWGADDQRRPAVELIGRRR